MMYFELSESDRSLFNYFILSGVVGEHQLPFLGSCETSALAPLCYALAAFAFFSNDESSLNFLRLLGCKWAGLGYDLGIPLQYSKPQNHLPYSNCSQCNMFH